MAEFFFLEVLIWSYVLNGLLRTCFGWRLKWPELILSNSGAYLHGLSINSSQLQSIRRLAKLGSQLILSESLILLMEDIPNNHLGCINLFNNGINYLLNGINYLLLINWRRISSINSSIHGYLDLKLLELFSFDIAEQVTVPDRHFFGFEGSLAFCFGVNFPGRPW